MKFLQRYLTFILPLFFFVVGLLTLYDYGMNWDSPVHFARGQAYLRYILTGKTNYNDVPGFCLNQYGLNSHVDYATGEICDRHRKARVSEYESNLLDFNSWVATATYGHPAFSDIMLAVSNNIFYKFLGWVEDINAYHLYSIFTTFLLALTVSIWTQQTFGKFAATIAVLTLYGFPLLFAESHFNIKDPPMAAFFTISLYFFWLALVKKRPLYLLFSALAGGASLGTKLNFVFAPFVLFPWIAAYASNTKFSFLSKKMVFMLLLYPIIVLLVFFLSWPALWTDPVGKFLQVIKFYQDIGVSGCKHFYFTRGWFTECTDAITLQYFVYTVPLFSLFLVLVGSIVSIFKFRENKYVTLLWLSLFIFTLLRVTLSLTSIYGGLRQIMEFVAPMSMIAGVGALSLRNFFAKILRKLYLTQKLSPKMIIYITSSVLILGYIPIYVQIAKMHPFQNVYFNRLMGGLKGAAERDFSGYGNSYGSVTVQGIDWLNKNAIPNATLALVSGNAQNISRASLREDIEFSNGSRSGYNLKGEYLMLSVVGQDIFENTFRYKYLDKFLEPVYDLKVDGISLLKIWKNDADHLKNGIKQDYLTSRIKANFTTEEGSKDITLNLKGKKNLKALGITLLGNECKEQMIGMIVNISENNIEYIRKADNINGFTDREINGWGADFVYLFTGDEAQYIRLSLPRTYQCKLSDIKLSVFTFGKEVTE